MQIHELSHIGQLKTISAGGCGLTGVQDLKSGTEVLATLKTEAFYRELKLKAEVRYVSDSGFTGLMFSTINSEDKAVIINYIRSQMSSLRNAA